MVLRRITKGGVETGIDRSWPTTLRFGLSTQPPKSDFEPVPPLYALLHFPMVFFARTLYSFILLFRPLPTTTSPHPIRIVTMSDTHDRFWSNVPEGDLLIHAGDLTNSGTIQDLQQQINWLKSLPHKHKVVIAGNHDAYLDPRARRTLLHSESEGELDWGDIHYLQHSSIRLTFPKRGARALHIYAAPHIPAEDQPSWAFTYPPRVDAWSDTVPNDVDVLVTHGPPQFHLDVFGVGCRYLLKECWRAKPKLHVFGHAHTGYGYEALFWDDFQRTYEILCARNRGACAVSSLLSIYNWLHLFSMIFYGMKSILWSNVWGGSDDATLMLNTSLSYQNSGKLGNSPQIALI